MTRSRDHDRLHLLGIRHHGPGSARGVLAALEAADPAAVLIEGPPDANDVIGFAASEAMTPPVAILVHSADDPSNSSFYPFATFSPEWVAMRWALAKGRPVRFIDLPSSIRLAERARLQAEQKADAEQAAAEAPEEPAADDTDLHGHNGKDEGDSVAETAPEGDQSDAEEAAEIARIRRDPLAYLAGIAGYEDSEAWWNALVEQGAHGPEIFVAIEQAMTALRHRLDERRLPEEAATEMQREAHMRLEIAETLAKTDGNVAVVCGAWHVPALRKKVAAKDDRALLKGLEKIKVTSTWVPWTDSRLAVGSGYGAGVLAPGWYGHRWKELNPSAAPSAARLEPHIFTSRWQTRVAALLRENGRPASTASVIESARLAISLAALRDLALPGLEEMREASLATLCEGEVAALRLIEAQLVIGQGVGEIDETVPQMPLAADLARWQRKLKLKPEALDTDLSLDLRSESGLARSLLLHRLNLIGVPWGRLQGSGSSRGTFRENWRLRWEPEFSVRLAEALVYGSTVEQASGNAAIAAATKSNSLAKISELVRSCLNAGLEEAANATIAMLQRQAAGSSDIGALAAAVPPLANILRYGAAREMPADALRLLVTSLVESVCSGLVYACRNLQAEEAAGMRQRLDELNLAMALIEDAELTRAWRRALGQVAGDGSAHPLLAGFAVRALYDAGDLYQQATALHLSRALSPSVSAADAGNWLEGFVGTSGQILLHDDALRGLIDAWLVSLGEEEFTNLLPMLRRAFSTLDASERRRLLDGIAKRRLDLPKPDDGAGHDAAPGFAAALPLLLKILGAAPPADTPDRSSEAA